MNVLNMPTSVNNCIIQCQKGHTPNEKRANFLVFDKSEGAPCPSAPYAPQPMLLKTSSFHWPNNVAKTSLIYKNA